MRGRLEEIRAEALEAVASCADPDALERVRIRFLGKKGALTGVLRGLRDVPPEDRRDLGELANAVKRDVEGALGEARERLEADALAKSLERQSVDVTLPGIRSVSGSRHPILRTLDEAVDVFVRMGFEVAEGPEVETDHYNFEALNIPEDHPARDMQDTFFVDGGGLLRTHTSPVQIRVMEGRKPPLRIVAPGAVFRIDDDATHSPMFHQVEGFLVDRDVTFGDLKGVLHEFLERMFGAGTAIRFRPSFFPFTEPSAEVDIGCFLCGGSGEGVAAGLSCRVCKGTGWIEILGSGLIDPNVLENVGYSPEEVSGFAFGIGIERVAMLRYGIADIRHFYENDVRFLEQF